MGADVIRRHVWSIRHRQRSSQKFFEVCEDPRCLPFRAHTRACLNHTLPPVWARGRPAPLNTSRDRWGGTRARSPPAATWSTARRSRRSSSGSTSTGTVPVTLPLPLPLTQNPTLRHAHGLLGRVLEVARSDWPDTYTCFSSVALQ